MWKKLWWMQNAICELWIWYIQNEWFNSCANVDNSKDVKKCINSFEYKCEALGFVMCVSIYIY
jgi:hypothetical protein